MSFQEGTYPKQSSSVTSTAPVKYYQDSALTDTKEDTSALTSSKPLPVQLIDRINGNRMTIGANGLVVTDAQVLAQLTTLVSKQYLDVVDQIDINGEDSSTLSNTHPLMDVATDNIPANGATPLTIVKSLAAAVKKIKSVEDIGEYLGIYSDPSGTPVLECILPLGGGEVEVALAAGTEIGIRHMKNSSISTATFIAINFMG